MKINPSIYIIGILLFLLPACEKTDFKLKTNADDFFFFRYKGSDMPVWVRGNTASKIMIIYLHGGPWGPGSFYWGIQESTFIKELKKDYAFAFYDQRGRASSQGHFDESFMTVEQFVEDMDKLINLLQELYGTDINFFVYGVSWGGYLGTAFVTTDNLQDRLKGLIIDSGDHNFHLVANAGKNMLMFYANQQMNINKNKENWYEILDWCKKTDTINDFDSFDEAMQYLTIANELMADSIQYSVAWNAKAILQMSYNSPYSSSSVFSNTKFNSEYSDNGFYYNLDDLTSKLSNVKLPVFLARGKYDFFVPQEVNDQMFEELGSDIKYKRTFYNSGHGVCNAEVELYINSINDFINQTMQ